MSRYTPKPEEIETVERMAAFGETHTDIAAALGCSMDHLKTHFMDHLLFGAVRKKRDLINKIFDSAENGSNAAIRDVLERIERGNAVRAPAPVEEKPRAVRLHQIGKKEFAQMQASDPDVADPIGSLLKQRLAG